MSRVLMKLRKHYELTPLITMVAGVSVMAGSYITYSLFTKSDVAVNRSGNPWPWQNVDPTKPQKLLTLKQEYKPIPELERLRREIGSPAHPRAST